VVRTHAKRRIIGSALVLASIGTVTAVSSAHAFDGTAHGNAHHSGVSRNLASPWMY
jgi:hypothetical protein